MGGAKDPPRVFISISDRAFERVNHTSYSIQDSVALTGGGRVVSEVSCKVSWNELFSLNISKDRLLQGTFRGSTILSA